MQVETKKVKDEVRTPDSSMGLARGSQQILRWVYGQPLFPTELKTNLMDTAKAPLRLSSKLLIPELGRTASMFSLK